MIAALVGGVTAILLYLLLLWLRNPVLVKLGVRNLGRRPAQTVLIILGLTLSTIILISSLGAGDTLRFSVQKQAVAAYGQVDEIIAPPLLALLASLGNPNASSEETAKARQTLDELSQGGIQSVLALIQGGLPSISTDRVDRLRAAAAHEPLIDGVAGSIVFPTIVRDVTTGRSEPLGFIFAVDDHYPQGFGLQGVDGQPLTMQDLEPGVGSIFQQGANLVAGASALPTQLGRLSQLGQISAQSGITLPAASQVLAALGALATGVNPDALPDAAVSLDTLDQLGFNTATLRALGRTTITLRELAGALALQATPEQLPPGAPVVLSGAVTETAVVAAASAALESSSLVSATLSPTTTVAALGGLSLGLLSRVNLNTVGADLDRTLAQFGLQLRQGDLYLNRLGAERLGARPGDIVELFIGPLPVRFRVRALVDEAGPLSALLPVVMLRLDEAQKLLFMPNQVNSVLISNTGDAFTGMEHTDAVSDRLRVLALDEAAVEQIAAILRRPDVVAAIQNAAARLPDSADATVRNRRMPAFARMIAETVLRSFNVEQMNKGAALDLLAAAQKPEDLQPLRELLARATVYQWLLNLTLPGESGRDLTDAATRLNQFEQIAPLNKATIVTAADVGGSVFSSLFSVFGIFSIVAALLLIVLIFVMLSSERRTEIGVARAIGVQRSQVVQMYMAEGMVYNLLAAALGVVLGIAITWAMTAFISGLFNDITGQINAQAGGIFAISFHIAWQSVIIAYCLGVIITWLTMTLAAWRVTRLNIATAIRDLPDAAERRRRSRLAGLMSWLLPLAVAGLGAWLAAYALPAGQLGLTLIGVTVTLGGAALLLVRLLNATPVHAETSRRTVYTILGLALLALWVAPWYSLAPQLWPGVFTVDITQAPLLFAAAGPMIVLGAILVIIFNADALSALASRVLGFVPALRPVLKTAVAYPLSTRFRTGITLLLFAMIMATVVVMAVIIYTTQSLLRLDDRQTAGFQIEVDPTLLSFFSPVEDLAAAIAARAGDPALEQVQAVAGETIQLLGARPAGSSDLRTANFSALSSSYFDQAAKIYHFQARAPGFADDAAVWQALQERDDVVILTPALFRPAPTAPTAGAQAPPRGPFARRLTIDGVDLGSGVLPDLYLDLATAAVGPGPAGAGQSSTAPTQRVQVIGVLSSDTTLAAGSIQGSQALLARLRGQAVKPGAFFVQVKPGADPEVVAAGIEKAFVASGLDGTVLADRFAQQQRVIGGGLLLLQGFMALGLLVGIAALGVISTRAVIERRQQVGMLRALGYQKSMVSLAFLLEASFISLSGLLIGALAGVVLGENMVRAFFPRLDLAGWSAPWGQIALIVLAAYLFSLLTTLLPAWQAARIYPAEALRYE